MPGPPNASIATTIEIIVFELLNNYMIVTDLYGSQPCPCLSNGVAQAAG